MRFLLKLAPVTRRQLLTAGIVAGVLPAIAGLWRAGYRVEARPEGVLVGRWVPLAELGWQYAQAAWLGFGRVDRPVVGHSIRGGPIRAGGREAEHGLGTYSLTEVAYRLRKEHALFHAFVGVEDDTWVDGGSARFLVELDGIVVFDSGPMREGDELREIEVPVAGAGELRLIAAPVPGKPPAFGGWVDASLFESHVLPDDLVRAQTQTLLRDRMRAREGLRDRQEATLAELAARTVAAVETPARGARDAAPAGVVGRVLERALQPDVADRGSNPVAAVLDGVGDGDGARVVLANERVGVILHAGGGDHALFTVVDRRARTVVAHRVGAAVALRRPSRWSRRGAVGFGADESALRLVNLHEDTALAGAPERSIRLGRLDDPVLGPGRLVELDLQDKTGGAPLFVRLAVLDDRPALVWEVGTSPDIAGEVQGGEDGAAGAVTSDVDPAAAIAGFACLGGAHGEWFFGDGAEYLVDFSRLRRGRLLDDGVERAEPVAMGSPVFVSGGRLPGGVLLAALDEHRRPARWSVRREPGHVGAKLTYEVEPAARRAGAPGPGAWPALSPPAPLASPRLYVELTESQEPVPASRSYRDIMAALYPAPPLPSWLRYQWGTWYVHEMEISQEKLVRHVDYIAEHFADLGPWHVLIDAGWYVAEGRPGAEWRRQDFEKLPRGLRWFVDYAHGRGVRVILYVASPYVDNERRDGNWLGLRGLIDQHPDWLIPLGHEDEQASYALNFAHPALRSYVREVMTDFFVRYGVDGMKIDAIGGFLSAGLSTMPLDEFGLLDPIVRQSNEIYRFLWQEATRLRPDAFLEGGWLCPRHAAPDAHTWRHADDAPTFHESYPTPGLVEHVDYAAAQLGLLGQRPHLGAAIDDPAAPANRWLLGAALAMGTQAVLSLDLTTLSPEMLATYRALLVHYRPFEGRTTIEPSLTPSVFATTNEGTTCLGLLNRETTPRAMRVDLAEYGLEPRLDYVAYDVDGERAFRVKDTLALEVPPESFRLLVLRRTPGVLWTSSSSAATASRTSLPNEFRLTIRGPEAAPGFLRAVVPAPREVRLAGAPLAAGADAHSEAGHYTYDAETGVLHLRYPHTGGPQVLRVLY
ncbi:MAG: NPCBM/NEW2 domain-containing protein [Chloroflexi bacterium]|nr:NPCBM/NEW2 domain-containing protein [Chloroflexota bacterium]